MDRRDFIKKTGLIGLGALAIPFLGLPKSSDGEAPLFSNPNTFLEWAEPFGEPDKWTEFTMRYRGELGAMQFGKSVNIDYIKMVQGRKE